MRTIAIRTADGTCPGHVHRPSDSGDSGDPGDSGDSGGSGPWPAVLVFMDGIGIRPAIQELAARLAKHGYLVLLPDLFYRAGPYEPMDGRTLFSDPEKRKILSEKFTSTTTIPNVMSDTRAFLDYLASEPDVRPGAIGAVGYCMGGGMALNAAGTYPDRFAAVASFHGSRLATDLPHSPHLLAPKMKARVYVAGAIEDAGFPDDMKARLEDALTRAGVDHLVETYPAKHGWVFPDTPVYDVDACERHWRALLALMDAKLEAPAA